MNALLLLGTVIGVAGLAVAAILSFLMGTRWRAAALGAAGLGWTGLYGAAVLVVSLASRETVLAVGTTKPFCGFYLDCHLGVSLQQDVMTPAIGDRRAGGNYHVLTLEFSNSARRVSLTPYALRLHVVDANGTRYERDRAAEAALAGFEPPALEQTIAAGGSYRVPVVFDLPRDIESPHLAAGEGLGIDRVIEGLLIGDEDSFLHRKTLLALPAPIREANVRMRETGDGRREAAAGGL